MNFEQYNAAEAQNQASFLAQFLILMRPFQDQELQSHQWYALLAAFYGFVETARYTSARLARAFYDDERRRIFSRPPSRQSVFQVAGSGAITQRDVFVGGAIDLDSLQPIVVPPRHNFHLNPYTPEIFIDNLEPSREEFSRPGATNAALQRVVARAGKEVAQGGRRTILGGIKTDPQPVVGWARVQGGDDSCGFCAMLIARGPVFSGSRGFSNAGLSMADNELQAIRIWQQFDETGDDEELMGLMNQWHPRCDCKVVPVFDEDDWPGREQYLRAEKLWEDVTKGFSSGQRRRTRQGRFTPTGGRKLIEFRKALGDGYKNPNPARI